MKAFVGRRYGPPETLRMTDVDTPAPDAGQVLVKVLEHRSTPPTGMCCAASRCSRGPPWGCCGQSTRSWASTSPRVEAVGGEVTRFKAGDEVYANLLDHGYGGFAEYVAVPVEVVSPKPANLSFEEAAAVPMAAVTALQGLRRHGEPRPAAGPDQQGCWAASAASRSSSPRPTGPR